MGIYSYLRTFETLAERSFRNTIICIYSIDPHQIVDGFNHEGLLDCQSVLCLCWTRSGSQKWGYWLKIWRTHTPHTMLSLTRVASDMVEIPSFKSSEGRNRMEFALQEKYFALFIQVLIWKFFFSKNSFSWRSEKIFSILKTINWSGRLNSRETIKMFLKGSAKSLAKLCVTPVTIAYTSPRSIRNLHKT